jgi:hypothetical protein
MWKTLQHPNVLPLIGVMMSETQFATISDWMVNGNINDFVKAHPDVNRLELVCFSLGASPPFIDDRITHPVGRRRLGIDLHPQPGNDPRGSQGGTFLTATTTTLAY